MGMPLTMAKAGEINTIKKSWRQRRNQEVFGELGLCGGKPGGHCVKDKRQHDCGCEGVKGRRQQRDGK